jgi:pimeloyl-ACP methyl ester carboxylesterase
MAEITRRTIETNGINMHLAEAGEGPLLVLCHGFPESWYSWRHQLPVLADAGYHVVAPDQRGYGGTDAPPAVEDYTLFHLVAIGRSRNRQSRPMPRCCAFSMAWTGRSGASSC